jgi:SAM-dependent methyltransferase
MDRVLEMREAIALLVLLLSGCRSGGEGPARDSDTDAPVAAPVATEPTPDATEAPPPVLHPPLTTYMDRTVAATMSFAAADWLTRNSREAEESASKLLPALSIEEGSNVCDFGCGNGFHTLELARLVGPRGHVYAVDVQPEMLVLLEQRVNGTGLENIEPILGEYVDPKLPPASCDMVLMVDVYHELGYPEEILAGVKRALRPGGRLVLVEYRSEDPLVPIKPEHKMSKAQAERELAANGFRLIDSFDELPWQHVLFFAAASD